MALLKCFASHLRIYKFFNFLTKVCLFRELVKWQQSSYAECSWETAADIGDDEKIEAFYENAISLFIRISMQDSLADGIGITDLFFKADRSSCRCV